MKKTLVLALALVVAAGMWSGVAAIASSQSKQAELTIPSRLRALESKVRVLRTQVNDLRGKQACLTALPLSQFGTSAAGYVYTPDGGYSVFFTSALDVTPTGQSPGAWAARINPSCVTQSSASRMSTSSYRADRSIASSQALK